MQLSHISDRPVDLKTQIQDLTRNTTDILLLEIPMIDNSNELYFDVKRITDMDWNDATHEVHTEFVPRHKLRGLDRTGRHRPSHEANQGRSAQRLAPSLTPLLSAYAR